MAEFTLVNLLTLLIGISFLTNGYYLARAGREDLIVLLMSAIIGFGLMFVSVFPDVFSLIGDILGINIKGRAILVVSNLTLFVIVAYQFDRIGRLKKDISRLNEELSLLRQQVEEGEEG